MKKTSKILLIIIALIIVTTSSIYAFTGIMDTNDNIIIQEQITNGNGIVDITRDVVGYKLYYQWVEIDNSIYKQIKQLKDELQIIQYFNIYEATQDDEYYEYYYSAQNYYKETYGTILEDCSEQKVNENFAKIKTLLPDYTDNWIQTTDNKFNMDLATFSGTRDYVVWVQLEKKDGSKVFDAEVFELTGTKQETSEDNSQKIDKEDNIFISEIITNGEGIIEISRDVQGYKLYYQWIEIDNNLYKQIKKLKDELQIIQYFNIYEATQDDKDYEYYYSSQEYYKETYGTYLEDCSEQKVNENFTQISKLLPKCEGIWTKTTDNKYNIDLSTFSGTKNFVLWVQLEKQEGTKVYDAEIFELTGTKKPENTSDIIDKEDNIFISDIMTNGQGTIEITRDVANGYKLYYQWVEIDNDLYKQIRKLKDELQVIQFFNLYEATKDDEYYEYYYSSQEYYKEKYGTYLEDCSEQKVYENLEKITKLLPNYTNNWTQTTDNTFKMDLSSFSGTKDYVLWVQLEKQEGTKVYDAEIFELIGTKQEDNKPGEDDNKPDDGNKPGEDDNKPDDDNKPGEDDNKPDDDNKPEEDNNKPNNDKTTDNTKNDTTTSTSSTKTQTVGDSTKSSKTLPYAGIERSAMISGIIALTIVAIVTFIKYRKIK